MTYRSRSRIDGSLLWILLVLASAAAPPATESQYPPSGTLAGSNISPVVSKAAFSQDGKLGALVYRDGVTLLDLENWREKCLIHKEGIGAIALAHNGTKLAISTKGSYENSPIGETAPFVEIQIIDVRTGTVERKFSDARATNVLEMVFTPAGALFAVVANPGPDTGGPPILRGLDGLFLWDVIAGKLTPLLTRDEARKVVRCVAAFAPDGDALVLSLGTMGKEEVKLYSTAAVSVVRKIDGSAAVETFFPGGPVRYGPLAISDDGKMLAYGASYMSARPGSNEIVLYDLVKGKVARRIRHPLAGGMSLAFLADGGLAALPSIPLLARLQAGDLPSAILKGVQNPCTVTIWNLANGKIEKRMDLPSDAVVNLLVPRHNAVASLSGSNWSVRDLETSEVKAGIVAESPQCMPPSPARLSPEIRKALQSFTIHRILAVSFFPDRPGVLIGANDDGVAYFWNIATGKELQRNQFAASANCIAISENGRTVAVAGEDGKSVFVLEEDGSTKQIPLTDFAQKAGALAASPRGDMLAFGGTDGTLGIWDVKNQVVIRQWKGHSRVVRSIAFSSDGTMLASSADDLTLKVWSVGTGAMVQNLEGHKRKVNAVAFGAGTDAVLASGGDDSRIILWDVTDRRIVRMLSGHKGSVRSISFSPDGSILVSGADDGVRVWNVKTGKTVKVLLENSAQWTEGPGVAAGQPTVIGGNDITVMSIRFSADGKVVAAGGTNNTAMVWDTKTWGRRVLRPIGK